METGRANRPSSTPSRQTRAPTVRRGSSEGYVTATCAPAFHRAAGRELTLAGGGTNNGWRPKRSWLFHGGGRWGYDNPPGPLFALPRQADVWWSVARRQACYPTSRRHPLLASCYRAVSHQVVWRSPGTSGKCRAAPLVPSTKLRPVRGGEGDGDAGEPARGANSTEPPPEQAINMRTRGVCTLSGLALAWVDITSRMLCLHQPSLQPRMLRCLSMAPVPTRQTGGGRCAFQCNGDVVLAAGGG